MNLLKDLLEFCLSPVGIMTIALGAGACGMIVRNGSRFARRLLVTGVLLFFVFSVSPLAELLISSLEQEYPPLRTPDTEAGYRHIVVLSGYGESHSAVPVTSRVSAHTLCCIAETIRIHKLLPEVPILASGGVTRRGHEAVAVIMADLLVQLGVPSSLVKVETGSTTTYENLVETHRLIASDPFVLVAAACDLPRAMAVARKLGMNPTPAPACIWALGDYPAGMTWGDLTIKILQSFSTPSFKRLSYLQWAHHEYLGYLWYAILGRV